MTGNSYSSRLSWMFVLSMAPCHRNLIPAIGFYHLNNITNFHLDENKISSLCKQVKRNWFRYIFTVIDDKGRDFLSKKIGGAFLKRPLHLVGCPFGERPLFYGLYFTKAGSTGALLLHYLKISFDRDFAFPTK